jgi:calcineurin-like phosphoesterase family protein
MNIWFTSDTHFNHSNISSVNVSNWESGYRKFGSLNEMNEVMVDNINHSVKVGDVLYHLGDFAFGKNDVIEKFRKCINCKTIHLIYGNHDKLIRRRSQLRSLFTTTNDVITDNIGGVDFHLSHYSHQVWPESHRGRLHLFGHSHSSIDGIGRSMDVGVDNNDFYPFHIDEIRDILSKVDFKPVDHHK